MPRVKRLTSRRGTCNNCGQKLRTRRDGFCGAICAGEYRHKPKLKPIPKRGKCRNCGSQMNSKRDGYCGPDCAKSGRTCIDRLYQLLRVDGSSRCAYCMRKLEFKKRGDKNLWATKDHIIPKSKGGNDIRENLALCCFQCNQLKADRRVDQLLRDPEFQQYALTVSYNPTTNTYQYKGVRK